jgi:alpha-N-arabinofuranosidase
LLSASGAASAAEPQAPAEVSITIDSGRVLNRIDEKVYGHFLEHIYHSCNGGLWGELVWNRSFEDNEAGEWRIEDGAIVQAGRATNQRFLLGDSAWSDYELTLRAKKTGGAEGFLILFRAKGEDEFYWCNLGGWGNERHQIERGLADGRRWGGVGPSVRGSIETGRWYSIKVRCDGRRFRVWLDDALLIDFTDDERALLTGRVGVGTWGTTAEFRDLQVIELEGKDGLRGKKLYEGAPEALDSGPSVAKGWKVYGRAKAFIDRESPRNSSVSQRIVAGFVAEPGGGQGSAQAGGARTAGGQGPSGESAGLEQAPLRVAKGETYVGSFWARGSAPGGLVARLLDGDRVLASASLPAPKAEWGEVPLRLVPAEASDGATLQVGLVGAGAVSFDQVSLSPRSWQALGGFRPDLLKAVAGLRPPVIRWPGGCFASAYRWKDGIGPQRDRKVYPIEIWDDRDVNSFGTDEFIDLCRQVGAEPLIVVNIGTANWNPGGDEAEFLQDVRDWIEYSNGPADSRWGAVRAANGRRDPYDVTFWEIDNETWHMGAERYAEAVRRFAPAMREVDPSIRLAACGSGGYGGGALAWNRTIIERCADLVDFISIHHYEGPENFARGPLRYEEFFRQTAELIAASKNPKLKVYVSEWNAQSTDWRTGLYAGGLLNAFERSGAFLEMGGPALFLRHVSATAWDNAFVNFDHRTWFAAPNYVVMKLWREHYAPELVAIDGDLGPLNAVATRSGDGRTLRLKAVNPTAAPASVRIDVKGPFLPSEARLTLIAPGSLQARNDLERPDVVRPEPGEAALQGGQVRATLPPLSAGVVVVEGR